MLCAWDSGITRGQTSLVDTKKCMAKSSFFVKSSVFSLSLMLHSIVRVLVFTRKTHGHFCLIFGDIAILTNSSTLISKIVVAKLNSCVKMAFWDILL